MQDLIVTADDSTAVGIFTAAVIYCTNSVIWNEIPIEKYVGKKTILCSDLLVFGLPKDMQV